MILSGLMFPWSAAPTMFLKAKALIAGWGVDVDAVELGIMVEIPSSAILIEDFCKAGISFASFGTNDLIQYTLAIDRNNELVSSMYRQKHPAALQLIRDAIAVCRQYAFDRLHLGQTGSNPQSLDCHIR